MTDETNIIQFPGMANYGNAQTLLDEVLKTRDRLESLCVIGFTDTGQEIFGVAVSDAAELLFNLELAKFRLLESYARARG